MVEESGSNCLHYLRKLHGLPCACELVNRCQHLMPIQKEDIVIFWRKLEIGSDIPKEHHRDMESEMCDLTSLLQEISTGPISNVREVRRLIKAVVNPPETAAMKRRRKTNSTKRDKSHWEYVSIAHRKIGKSSGSGSESNPSPRGRGRPSRSGRSRGRGRSNGRSSLLTVVIFMYQFIQNWKNVVGDGNCGFRVVSNILFGDENHWVEIRRRMSYDLRHSMHSTTVLPLVSSMDGPSGTIFIGLIEELQHFIQLVDGCPFSPLHVKWEYHRDMRVSGWAVPYRNRMADWVKRYSEMYPPQKHFM
ncbi:hypothetical protein M9H77_32243 [Catharanthus roseus]|uniref:Uncharacterized protein n=1 Tax=Catharanthus roseus TaxID=4058 RepID=A0ACC0A3A4_CATRO|nr:hypothetical protein M9H77_32243 [Catharanthus roseus]